MLSELTALAQVVLIDVVLAGDNAVVVGLAVAGLPAGQRKKAIILGIGAAALIRVALAFFVLSLLEVIGLVLAGGLILLWVCWRMARELRAPPRVEAAPAAKSLRAAMLQIMLADISMSLDNVLAVAGAARAHPWVLAVGLILSVALMGVAAGLLSRVLARWRWLAWIGLVIVVYVALRMIWDGSMQVAGAM